MIQIVDDNYNFCPDILYKYRKWDENGKKVLTDCQLYLARPDSFEDEFDCNPIIEPLSHEEFLAWTISKLKLQNPGWDYKILAEEAEKLWLISPMKTKEGFKAMLERMRKEFGNIFGVLSMTEVPDNPFMWNEYSGNHTGFLHWH